jgi:hypothetical protein
VLKAVPGGGVYLGVELTYHGSTDCTVSAYGPTARLRDAQSVVLAEGSNTTLVLLSSPLTSVRPGAKENVDLSWIHTCATSSPAVAVVNLYPSGSTSDILAGPSIDVSSLATAASDPAHCNSHVAPTGVKVVNLD